MKKSIVLFTVLTLLVAGQAFALSLMNKVPAVSGKVVGPDGKPVAGVKITVNFLGTNDSIWDEDKEVFTIKSLSAVTNDKGVYELEGCRINATHIKGKFLGADVKTEAKGYKPTTIRVVNMRAVGGVAGVLIIGFIDAQGDDFNTSFIEAAKHAFKITKESKFSRAYPKALADDIPLEKETRDEARSRAFPEVHPE